MSKRASQTVATLFVVALLAAPAAWAQAERGKLGASSKNQRPATLGPSIHIGSVGAGGVVETQPSDAASRRDRRARRVARQTGVDVRPVGQPEASIGEDSSSLLNGDRVRQERYNPVASRLLDAGELSASEMAAIGEDTALACDPIGAFGYGFWPALGGTVAVTPPDDLPPLGSDVERDAADSDGDS